MVTGSWHPTQVSARPMQHIDEDNLRLWVRAGLLLAGIATLGLLYFTIAGSVGGASREIQELRTESRYWEARTEQLKVELAGLQAVERISSEAPQRLGMALPKADAVAYRAMPSSSGVTGLPALAFADPAATSLARDATALTSSSSDAKSLAAEAGWWERLLAAVWPVQVGQAQELAPSGD